MQFLNAAAVIVASRNLNEDQFAKNYPRPALILEPFEGQLSGPTKDTTTRLPLQGPSPEITRKIHERSKVVWFDDPKKIVVNMGRDNSCDVVLPHPAISKQHAALQQVLGRNGPDWILSDNRSTNGTWLNGRAITCDRSQRLTDGDAIMLGDVVLIRPFFQPRLFYQVLRAADSGYVPAHVAHGEKLERLASTFRALGLEAENIEGELRVRSTTGLAAVRVRVEPGTFIVESSRGGVHARRSFGIVGT